MCELVAAKAQEERGTTRKAGETGALPMLEDGTRPHERLSARERAMPERRGRAAQRVTGGAISDGAPCTVTPR